jgi:hypothetical protein
MIVTTAAAPVAIAEVAAQMSMVADEYDTGVICVHGQE